MEVVNTFVRKSVMLPIGASSYLMWKAFRDCGNGVERLFELVEHSSDMPVVSWQFHLWYRRGCCDGSSSSLGVVTTAAVQWWLPLKFRIRRRTFLSCWPGIRQRQWRLLGETLTRLVIVLKVRLFFWIIAVLCWLYMYLALLCVSFIFIKVSLQFPHDFRLLI